PEDEDRDQDLGQRDPRSSAARHPRRGRGAGHGHCPPLAPRWGCKYGWFTLVMSKLGASVVMMLPVRVKRVMRRISPLRTGSEGLLATNWSYPFGVPSTAAPYGIGSRNRMGGFVLEYSGTVFPEAS